MTDLLLIAGILALYGLVHLLWSLAGRAAKAEMAPISPAVAEVLAALRETTDRAEQDELLDVYNLLTTPVRLS